MSYKGQKLPVIFVRPEEVATPKWQSFQNLKIMHHSVVQSIRANLLILVSLPVSLLLMTAIEASLSFVIAVEEPSFLFNSSITTSRSLILFW